MPAIVAPPALPRRDLLVRADQIDRPHGVRRASAPARRRRVEISALLVVDEDQSGRVGVRRQELHRRRQLPAALDVERANEAVAADDVGGIRRAGRGTCGHRRRRHRRERRPPRPPPIRDRRAAWSRGQSRWRAAAATLTGGGKRRRAFARFTDATARSSAAAAASRHRRRLRRRQRGRPRERRGQTAGAVQRAGDESAGSSRRS